MPLGGSSEYSYNSFRAYSPSASQLSWVATGMSTTGANGASNCFGDGFLQPSFDQQLSPSAPLMQDNILGTTTVYNDGVDCFDNSIGGKSQDLFNPDPSFFAFNANLSLPFPGINNYAPPLIAQPSQAMQAPLAASQQTPIPCTQFGCSVTFKRDPGRIRHEAAVHGINQLLQLYLCPVVGCTKSQGTGYTRKDKLTEHLWKKHKSLGYRKRV
jgi:hypothetical protein